MDGKGIGHFGFCPNLSLSFRPPLAGVEGVGTPGVPASAGIGDGLGIWSLVRPVEDGVLGPALDCLNVIRGAGGGMPGSSRLRFEPESLESPGPVRTLADR